LRWALAVLAIPCVLAQTPDPIGDPAIGKRLFESQCALCHGQTGGGGRGPNLHRPKLNKAANDADLAKVISQGIQPEMPGAWQLSPREVNSVVVYVRTLGSIPLEPLPGDPSRGERLFKTKACDTCHMIRGQGSGFGPELTGIGAKRSAAFLRESLVAPEAVVPDDFLLVELVTSAGVTISGVRMNEDTFSIQIKEASGELHSFRKSALKDLRKLRGKSPMPSYDGTLNAEEMNDLIAYLASLRENL
jgi:putative heme-binding domain-containing protein